MLGQSWFYPLILLIYVLSILLYFIDFLQHNRKANRWAFWLLSIVWGIQTFYFVFKAIAYQTLPFSSSFDTLFFYAWLLISLSLFINWLFRMDFLLFFTNLVAFTVLSVSLFVGGREFTEEMAAQVTSEWVVIHVSMAFFSYAAFTLSFIFSAFYVIQYHLLKRKKWGPRLRRLPNLKTLDLYTFRFNLVALPLLFLSLILGVIWAFYTLDDFVLWDGKVLLSLLVTLFYGFYFYERIVKSASSVKVAEVNMVSFALLIINYLFSTFFSEFHM